MGEESLVVVPPHHGVVGLDSEGVDSAEGLKVDEVRNEEIWGERIAHTDVNLSSVLEKAPLAHERQKTELRVVAFPSQMAVFLFQGEDASIVP